MPHRGPDRIAHWSDDHVALGHCLLRTTEEAEDEAQPLANDDGSVVLVMDGTLWNAPELRTELLRVGVHLRSRADSELVLRAYEIWGRSSLSHVDGDFALAIYDRRKRDVFCTRDRIGMRPFHYHAADGGICFASDPEALIALSFVPRRLNEARIADAIVGGLEGYNAECTFYVGISRLPAAHSLIVTADALSVERYWTFAPLKKLKLRSDGDYENRVRTVLSEAVRRRLRGGGETGAMLSGGFDSTSVAALGRKIRAEEGHGQLATVSALPARSRSLRRDPDDPDGCRDGRS